MYPRADYLDIKNNPNVALAIPIAVGDNYHGYRLVGTIPEMFEKVEYAPGKHYELEPGGKFLRPHAAGGGGRKFCRRRKWD